MLKSVIIHDLFCNIYGPQKPKNRLHYYMYDDLLTLNLSPADDTDLICVFVIVIAEFYFPSALLCSAFPS